MGTLYEYTLEDMARSYLHDNEIIEQRMEEIAQQMEQETEPHKIILLRRRYNALRAQSNDLIRTAHYLQHYYDKD